MGFFFDFSFIASHRITNDARECEMEENMGQVNTMIGNVFRMPMQQIVMRKLKKTKIKEKKMAQIRFKKNARDAIILKSHKRKPLICEKLSISYWS